jgi:hypothetical protein
VVLELQAPSIGGQRAGDFYLSQFEQQTDDEWIWAGIVFNLVFLSVTTVISAVRHGRSCEIVNVCVPHGPCRPSRCMTVVVGAVMCVVEATVSTCVACSLG